MVGLRLTATPPSSRAARAQTPADVPIHRIPRSAMPASALPLFGVHAAASRNVAAEGVNPVSASENLALLQQVGAQAVRWQLNWQDIETARGIYSYPQDATIRTFADAGIRPVLIVQGGNTVYGSRSYVDPLTTRDQFIAFAACCVDVYRQYAAYDPVIEINNEPNNVVIWPFLSDPGTAANSAANQGKQLDFAVKAVKGAYPNATVIAPAPSTDSSAGPLGTLVYFANMLANMSATAITAISAWNFHTYFDPRDGSTPDDNYWYGVMSPYSYQYGRCHPFFCSEQGIYLTTVDGDVVKQAALVGRSLVNAIIYGWRAFIHYNLIDDGTDLTNPEFGLGLIDFNFAAKPSALIYRSVMRAISGCVTYDVETDVSGSVYIVTIHKASSTVVILSGATARSAVIIPNPGFAQAKDGLGHAVPYTSTGGALSVDYDPSKGPLFLSTIASPAA